MSLLYSFLSLGVALVFMLASLRRTCKPEQRKRKHKALILARPVSIWPKFPVQPVEIEMERRVDQTEIFRTNGRPSEDYIRFLGTEIIY